MRVIGVSFAGEHRAYATHALSGGPGIHVVNDLIGGRPVSVTFCDVTDCARVFTRSGAGEELDLWVTGMRDGKMALSIEGREFVQDDEDVPLDEWPYERTTWKEWKAAHPGARVYMGASRQTDSDSAAD